MNKAFRRFHLRASRSFHSRAEHRRWVQRIVASRMPKPEELAPVNMSAAPFFANIDPAIGRLQLWSVPQPAQHKGTPQASCIQATYSLSSDPVLLRLTSDLSLLEGRPTWASFRQRKFYEALDALTADGEAPQLA
jgi:hypothetical protein